MHVYFMLLAVLAGVMLGGMLELNTRLAGLSSALMASWFAHGIGMLTAGCLFLLLGNHKVFRPATTEDTVAEKPPFWAYLGGLPGALVVALTAITASSSLGLTGTLLLGLGSQFCLALAVDRYAWFGMVQRKFCFSDFLSMAMILSGCGLLIMFKGD